MLLRYNAFPMIISDFFEALDCPTIASIIDVT